MLSVYDELKFYILVIVDGLIAEPSESLLAIQANFFEKS
jgi:hypothetical protein